MAAVNQVGNGLTGATGTGTFVGSTSPTITTPVIAQINDSNGNEISSFTPTSSAVNWTDTFNATTGNAPGIQARGSDTDVAIKIQSQAAGAILFSSQNTTAAIIISSGTAFQHITQMSFSNTSNTVNVTFPDSSGTVTLLGNSSTGSGSVVLETSPSLTTPSLGVATATSISFGGSTLSTYATNSWTPALSFGGSSTGITYSVQTGTYTQIGNVTYFTFNIALTNKGAQVGNAQISIPGPGAAGGSQTLSLGIADGLTFSGNYVVGVMSSNVATLYSVTSVTGLSVLADTAFSNTTQITGNGFYF